MVRTEIEMNRNKKVFIVLALIFFGIMGYVSYDISSRTTFPGSKPQLKERIQEEIINTDTTKSTSIRQKVETVDSIRQE